MLTNAVDVLFPAVYVLFFLGTILALLFANRRRMRQVWLAGFFATLLAVTAVGMPLFPVVEMHKFSQPSDEEVTYYELRVVDVNGTELPYDDRATPPVMGTRTSSVAGKIAADYTDAERLEMGEFYLENARTYRDEVESGNRSALERLQPPRYVDEPRWNADDLESYDEFTALRVYERTLTFSDDNAEVASSEERLRVTIDVADSTVTEHEREEKAES